MFQKIKQLFCNHMYITYLQDKPFYISAGDEYHDRKSKHYLLHCQKCFKQIEVVSKWRNEDIEKTVFQGKENPK